RKKWSAAAGTAFCILLSKNEKNRLHFVQDCAILLLLPLKGLPQKRFQQRKGKTMEKRYGLPTAICMVVGIVIGSGVFFKAEKVLQATQGNMPLGILAWGIVGAIM